MYTKRMKTKQEILAAAKSNWTRAQLDALVAGSSKKVCK